MMLLNRTDYLKTARGAQGGYKLAKHPSQYTLGEILRMTEGSISPVACLEGDQQECERHETCMARQVWQGLADVIANYADNLTLQDILDKYGENIPLNFSI